MAKQFRKSNHIIYERMPTKELVIILDPAHDEKTAGKRSPDGRHREYKWSRARCFELADELNKRGYTVHYTNPGDGYMSNTARMNAASSFPGKYKLMISVHNNAAGNEGKWLNATGYGVYTTIGQTRSDEFAEILLDSFIADFPELVGRFDKRDGDKDKENKFTVLMGAGYWAVLIEWMFQDSKKDLLIIENPDYNRRFVNAIIDAVEVFNATLNA